MVDVEHARAAAFAPGHVTGLFSIHDGAPELEKRGSCGAGFSLARGVLSLVEIEPADSLDIRIELRGPVPHDPVGNVPQAPVTREAVTNILRQAVRDARIPLNKDAPQGTRARVRVNVRSDVQLPVSQGFGMSAAGALSAAMALAKCLRLGRSDALRAAHAADVQMRGGLGDVIGASVGGFELRIAPGLPPHGATARFVGFGECVLCVVGGELETKSVLTDEAKRSSVNAAGERTLEALQRSPTLDAFLALSQKFARESGLITPEIERAIHAARPYGAASMSMLGNSVFAFGNVRRLADALAPFGEVIVCAVDEAGARLVEIE